MNKFNLTAASVAVFFSISSYASNTEFNLSGKVTAAMIADSDISGVGANNLSSVLYAKESDGEVSLDTTLTRLNFGTKTALDNGESLDSFIAFDFNNLNNGEMNLRFREGYIKWNSGNSTLLAGQTWSTMMDMNAYPSMVLEPTITGVVFTRQPMLRFSQDFGAFKYDLAIEQGKDAIKQTGVPGEVKGTVNTPDLILGLETNTELFWLRATGVVNQIKAKRGEEERLNELGYGFQVSGGLKITDKDFWNVSYFNSHGHDRYVLGSNGTSSQVTGSGLDVEKSQAIWTSIGHTWSENVKSTIGYGAWKSDTPELSQMTELTESQFALANVKYTVRENLTLGAEYNYTKATTAQKPTKDNHRLILAIDYQF